MWVLREASAKLRILHVIPAHAGIHEVAGEAIHRHAGLPLPVFTGTSFAGVTRLPLGGTKSLRGSSILASRLRCGGLEMHRLTCLVLIVILATALIGILSACGSSEESAEWAGEDSLASGQLSMDSPFKLESLMPSARAQVAPAPAPAMPAAPAPAAAPLAPAERLEKEVIREVEVEAQSVSKEVIREERQMHKVSLSPTAHRRNSSLSAG